MGLIFFREFGGSRIRQYDAQPFLLDNGLMESVDATQPAGLSYEIPADEWQKIDVSKTVVPDDWAWKPRRFIDGKHRGQVATCLFSAERYPVPVYLSQIGAVEMCIQNNCLRRTNQKLETVVALMAHLFPWERVESLATALQIEGYRMLIAEKPQPLNMQDTAAYSYDFERMRKTTHNCSNDEMLRHEKQILANNCNIPTIIDGRLEPRASAITNSNVPTVGVIKTHSKNYLHARGWQTFYSLMPCQRTPAFLLSKEDTQDTKVRFEVISWYLRLAGSQNEMPNYGVVRVEIPYDFFKGKSFDLIIDYINWLSQFIYDYRSHDANYARSAISISPIQRAEESLGSLLPSSEAELSHFYHLTRL